MYISTQPPVKVSPTMPLKRYLIRRSTLLRRESTVPQTLSCSETLSGGGGSAMIDEIISASSEVFVRTVAVTDRKQTCFSDAIARTRHAISGYCMLVLTFDGSIMAIHIDTCDRRTVELIHTTFLKFCLSHPITESKVRWYAHHKHGSLLGVRRFDDILTTEDAARIDLEALV